MVWLMQIHFLATMEEENSSVAILQQISFAVQNSSPNLYELIHTLSESGLKNSPQALDFISSEDWNFINQLYTLLSSSDQQTDEKTKIITMRFLISLGVLFPPIWKFLATKRVTRWIYKDLQEENEEIIFCSLTFFTQLLQFPLPEKLKKIDKLGLNLVELLISFVTTQYTDADDSISEEALHCLLRVAAQFESVSFTENNVLSVLYDHSEKSELGQRFISYLNRCNTDELHFIATLVKNILSNSALADSFFYTNDSKVLLDVIIRELNDLPETNPDHHRMLHLRILDPYLRTRHFRKELYRSKDLRKALSQFAEYTDKLVTELAGTLLERLEDYEAIKQFQIENNS